MTGAAETPLTEDEAAALKKEIAEAWRKNAEHFKSLRMEFKTKHTDIFQPGDIVAIGGDPDGDGAPINEQKLEWTNKTELKLAGRKICFATLGDRSFPGRRVEKSELLASFDGETEVTLFAANAALFNLPGAMIFKKEKDEKDSAVINSATRILGCTLSPFNLGISPIDLLSPNATSSPNGLASKVTVALLAMARWARLLSRFGRSASTNERGTPAGFRQHGATIRTEMQLSHGLRNRPLSKLS
jgi:hypothetical protein